MVRINLKPQVIWGKNNPSLLEMYASSSKKQSGNRADYNWFEYA
jgi:hypothetical protein